MPKAKAKAKTKTRRARLRHQAAKLHPRRARHWWQQTGLWKRVAAVIVAIVVVMVGTMYGIARWYIARHADEPLQIGATFIPRYARHFELIPQDTLRAMIEDLGLRRFRFVSYWDEGEPEQGKYDFSDLDWQFQMAEKYGAKVSLALGLRQPRWPECHMPSWAEQMEMSEWSQHLKTYMGKVIERYKDSPALESYQLENEFFLKVFGICPDHSRERLVDEYNFVKQLDPETPLIVSRSNNALGWPVGEPTPDVSAVSIYKRVWDKTITKRYFEYPFPAWFYGFLGGITELTSGTPLIIHELQAEAWGPNDQSIKDISITEQNKSLDARRLKNRFSYAEATGIRTFDLWGVEWWYWRKIHKNEPSLWNTAKDEIARLTGPTAQ